MRRALVAGALVLAVATTGCNGYEKPEPAEKSAAGTSSTSGPRPLTTDESERLAVARFNNYDLDGGLRAVELTAVVNGQPLTLTGRADFRGHRAIASLVTGDAQPSYGALAWNLRTAGLLPTAAMIAPEQLVKAPQQGWQDVHGLSSDNGLDTLCRIVLNLAADRPENALLLRQNGAEWKGSTTLGGVDVDLMSATAGDQGQALTYYIDEKGAMARVDVTLEAGQPPATITFLPDKIDTVPTIKAIRP